MEANESKASLRKGAATDLWRTALSRTESVFERLVCLSSLRDPDSNSYEHFGLARIHGWRETDRALREAHRETFSEWLRFPLREQWTDLDRYLCRLGVDKRLVLREWERRAAYRNLAPADASDAERELYLCDFEVILALMRLAYEAQLQLPTDSESWSNLAAIACRPRLRSECG